MKNLIKIIALFLVIATALSLFASCGGDNTTDTKKASSDSELSDDSENGGVEVDFEKVEPKLINPLTGLEASYDVSKSRPLGVMLNNIWDALPQVGIGDADIIFECVAEGGITRLFALFSEYNNLDVIGSVRSSRPYYIDFAQTFDAIYCHAGGSEDAYANIANRGINNIDGVRGDPLGVYYRDEARMQTMAIEHTLMTTGAGLIRTIEYCNYRTDLRDGFEYPFTFAKWGEKAELKGSESKAIHLPISSYQTVDYKYDEETDTYLRFQYDGTPHIDGKDEKQLAFTNVIVLFCNTYPYDNYGRMKVETVGDGDGYLASGGEYIAIKWHRDNEDGNAIFTRADNGEVITLNRGKTFINVCALETQANVDMNVK